MLWLVIVFVMVVAGLAAYKYLLNANNGFDPESLRGARVVVTGCSTGVGEQVAYQYAKHGAKVVITARREERLKEVVAKMKDLGAQEAIYVAGDMGKAEDCERTIETASSKLGGLDYIILNHWGCSHKRGKFPKLWDADPDMDFLADYTNINYLSHVRLASLALPMLKESQGNITVVTGLLGKVPNPTFTFYTGAKFALDGFFSSLRCEMKPHNVSITLAVLGSVDTDGLRGSIQDLGAAAREYFMKTVAQPEDTAKVIIEGATLRKREIYHPSYTRATCIIRAIAPSMVEK
ncbi:hydroxysteroid 11-beta-dehydrogenase 1-like protein B isoform X2 [Branchiostoma lanceolatum]|uniref:hydroxysteroid 11-beta-dehydrogenase 1-like protein B isoform X1 n=1 Tax=Branchiostoma lanceolatum TaxID=7740 RepID=UPI00345476F8